MTSDEHFINIIDKFADKRILVVGDLILDVYLSGKSTRLCPEAPVPVVTIDQRTVSLGGAANTACNLRALGASVGFCTVIGCDTEGDQALSLLEHAGIDTTYVIRDKTRNTITKSRVVSGSQIVTRIDQGSEDAIDPSTAHALARFIANAYDSCDAMIISDYEKGVITEEVLKKICALNSVSEKFIAVDSKRLPFFARLGPSCAKPNYHEVLQILGERSMQNRVDGISQRSRALYEKINAQLILATLDAAGSLIIEEGSVTYHIDAPPSRHPSVSGAGDTYISAFVLAWLASHHTRSSAEIATAAASIAIEQGRTAACTQAELRTFFNIHVKYIATMQDLTQISEAYHAAGKKIAFTNGCFDILHSGHVTYLHKARKMADVLIVGLNTDESIRRIKGAGRPINALADRIQVIAGLSSVDHIVSFGNADDDTPIPLIKRVKPHVFVKGADYQKDNLPEAEVVEVLGGRVALIDYVPDHSTSRIISRIKLSSLPPTLSGLPK